TFDGRALGDHFEGRAAIRSFLEDWFGAYEELEVGLEEVRDLGNGVVFAVVVQNGRPAGSAGHLRQREGWVFVWVRGLIARLTIYELDEARAAAERLARERAGGRRGHDPRRPSGRPQSRELEQKGHQRPGLARPPHALLERYVS